MSSRPHAPSRLVNHPGAYMITGSTLRKQKLFDTPEKLSLLESVLLDTLAEKGWSVQAWAVFANHYHFVGFSPDTGLDLKDLSGTIHGNSARELNRIDDMIGRTVWYRCWDTRISIETSYMARLAYVHTNAVKHGLVQEARMYPWCSADWFHIHGHLPFVKTIMSFPTDKVNVYDDF
jgi:putative transposase